MWPAHRKETNSRVECSIFNGNFDLVVKTAGLFNSDARNVFAGQARQSDE